MYKKLKKDKKEIRHVSEAAAPAYRADSHSESDNDYTNASGHTSSESSRTAEFINVIVKSIMNNMENTVFDKLDTKIDAVDKKVDSNFISLTKSIKSLEKLMNAKFAAVDAKFAAIDAKFESLETNMNTKFAAVDAKIKSLEKLMNAKLAALSKENKIYQKFTLGLGTLILGATFKEEIMTLVMGLFGG